MISEYDSGIYDAMNKAVSLCQGEWVQFMNGDDRFYNQYVLSNVFSGKDYEGADILYGDALEQAIISLVLSVDPPSLIIYSKLSYLWQSTDSKTLFIDFSSL